MIKQLKFKFIRPVRQPDRRQTGVGGELVASANLLKFIFIKIILIFKQPRVYVTAESTEYQLGWVK
jgi:hypothetical protein